MRSAISPRLAMSNFINMFASLLDDDQWLVKFYQLTTFDQNRFSQCLLCQLRSWFIISWLQRAGVCAHVHFLAHFDERFRVRAWGAVEVPTDEEGIAM
ncbi:hypothetical protein KCP76_07090 [Salmonella enterica subsp. enterica serovar Weltevreden]|nr:hypothetical protein KCP76_07090 [Salmonella enterica subsp. enterica serovar Weltevreden]